MDVTAPVSNPLAEPLVALLRLHREARLDAESYRLMFLLALELVAERDRTIRSLHQVNDRLREELRVLVTAERAYASALARSA